MPYSEFLKILPYHKIWSCTRKAFQKKSSWLKLAPINTVAEQEGITYVYTVYTQNDSVILEKWKPRKTWKTKNLEGVILE
jgi:hypothetical protein